jgi:hypothetical protein
MGVSCVHGHYSHPHFIRARQAGQLPQEYRPQLRPQRHSFPGVTLSDGTGVFDDDVCVIRQLVAASRRPRKAPR